MKNPKIIVADVEKFDIKRGMVLVPQTIADMVKSSNRPWSEFEEAMSCGYFLYHNENKDAKFYGKEFVTEKEKYECVNECFNIWWNDGMVPVL